MWVLYRKAGLYLFDGQPERALEELRKYPELENTQDVVLALLRLGRDAEAAEVMEKLLKGPPETEIPATAPSCSPGRATRAGPRRRSTRRSGWERGSATFIMPSTTSPARYAALGQKNESLAWLRRTAADGFPCYPLFERTRSSSPLRSDRISRRSSAR